jgi:hypothetical protein
MRQQLALAQQWVQSQANGGHSLNEKMQERKTREVYVGNLAMNIVNTEARSIHWSPYDRVRVVNADP